MNVLFDSEIFEMATQLVSEDFNIWLAVTKRLGTLEAGDKAAVYLAARPYAEKRLWEAETSGDPDTIISALIRMADVAQTSGDYAVARTMIDKLTGWERKHPNEWPYRLSIAAHMLKDQGELVLARQYMEEAVAIARNTTRMAGCTTANMLVGLGIIAGAQGEVEYARQCFAESLVLWQAWKRKDATADIELFVCRAYGEFAILLLAHQQVLPAIELLAAIESIGQQQEDSSLFHENAFFQTKVAQARELTDDNSFAYAWNVGLTLTPEQIQSRLFSIGN